MAGTVVAAHKSVGERRALGKEARGRTPPSVHAAWAPATARPDPITDFSERYADRNEQDHEEFLKAIRSGRLEALEGV